MKRMWIILIAISLIMSSVMIQGSEEERTVTIVSFSGSVSIFKSGAEKAIEPEVGLSLEQGYQIVTGKDSEITLLIDEEDEVKIAQKTHITLEELYVDEEGNEQTGFRLWMGKIWNNIKTKLNIGESYEIRTPNAIMGARGTKYSVSFEYEEGDENTDLYVLEGRVGTKAKAKAKDEEPKEEAVQAGQSSNVSKGEAIIVKTYKVDELDLFTIDTLLEDIEKDPEAYLEVDQLKTELKEIRDEVAAREEEEEAADEQAVNDVKEQEEEGIIVDEVVGSQEQTDTVNDNNTNNNSNNNGNDDPPANVAVTGIDFTQSRWVKTTTDAAFELTYTITPTNATNKNVTYTVANEQVVQVAGNGWATPVDVGVTTVTVTTEDGTLVDTTTVQISSGIPVTGFFIDNETVYDTTGTGYRVTGTLTPANSSNQNVLWLSSDTAIATVDEEGYVTTLSKGSYKITGTTEDGLYQDEHQGYAIDASGMDPIQTIESYDVNQNGIVDQLIFTFDQNVGTVVTSDTAFTHVKFGTLDYDDTMWSVNGSQVVWKLTEGSEVYTGAFTDLNVPGKIFMMADHLWDINDSVQTVEDRISPLVAEYVVGYSASYNKQDLFKLDFTENVSFNALSDVEIVSSPAGNIIGTTTYSEDHYGIQMSGFVVGDRIRIKSSAEDAAGNGTVEQDFKLEQVGPDIFWKLLE